MQIYTHHDIEILNAIHRCGPRELIYMTLKFQRKRQDHECIRSVESCASEEYRNGKRFFQTAPSSRERIRMVPVRIL